MSEVDRLSNSGLYPMLPIADQQRKEGSARQQQQPRDPGSENPDPNAAASPSTTPRPPKSIIDEYA